MLWLAIAGVDPCFGAEGIVQTAFKTHGFNLVGRGEGAKELAGYRTFRPSVESVFWYSLVFWWRKLFLPQVLYSEEEQLQQHCVWIGSAATSCHGSEKCSNTTNIVLRKDFWRYGNKLFGFYVFGRNDWRQNVA